MARAGKFDCVVSSDGNFKITVGSSTWFKSGPTWFRANGKMYSTADHSLKLTKAEKLTGLTDNLGLFESQVTESTGFSLVQGLKASLISKVLLNEIHFVRSDFISLI